MVDANSGYNSVITALKVAKLCYKHDLTWLEEPLIFDNLNGLVKLRNLSPIPIAGG